MITCQYQVLRYMHDMFTGEFINVGVVVYCPAQYFLEARFTQRFSRITNFFPDANGYFVVHQLKNLERMISWRALDSHTLFGLPEKLDQITSVHLIPDNSALQFTPVKMTRDIEPAAALNRLFVSMVEKYIPDAEKRTVLDEDVWREKYKEHFDKYNVTPKLRQHKVTTQSDEFVFDKAWKNDIWHCYQPFALEQETVDRMKDKVYRWDGRLSELRLANEQIQLTILLSISPKFEPFRKFILSKLVEDTENLKVQVIEEGEAEKFAKELADEIALHEAEELELAR